MAESTKQKVREKELELTKQKIWEKELELNRWRKKTDIRSLIGGIFGIGLGAPGTAISINQLITYSWLEISFQNLVGGNSLQGYKDPYKTSIYLYVIVLLVSILFLILGAVNLRSFVRTRRKRSTMISALQHDIERLQEKIVLSDQETASASRSESGRPWKCTCGRVNAAYVGFCACGISRASLNAERMKREKQKQEREAAERSQWERENAGRILTAGTIEKPREDLLLETQQQTHDFSALRKLKSLLDDGIITQEEFSLKKKEYLGIDTDPVKENGTEKSMGTETLTKSGNNPVKYCPKCGKIRKPGARFCAGCGAKLDG